MDIRRGESALQQLEKGSVTLSALLQDMKAISQKVTALDQIQSELIATDDRLKGTVRHFDDKLLAALSPILQEFSIRVKDTSDHLSVLKFELSSQLTSLGNRIDDLERQQLRMYGVQKGILILLGVTCVGSLGALFFMLRPLLL